MTCGRFANGDYWVVGPVTVTGITPEFDSQHQGWEVNPHDIVAQGLDVRISDFAPELVPLLPLEAAAGSSILKAVSIEPLSDEDCRPCLQTAAVLTVVSEAPPDGGASVFRPPYFGAAKPYYSIDDLRTDLLPSLAPAGEPPGLDQVEAGFRRVQIEHKLEWVSDFIHPADNMPYYGADIATRNAEGALRLMLDDPVDDKRPALIAYVQYGIDLYHILLEGGTWPANGGHAEGRKLPLAFASVMLDDGGMRSSVSGSNDRTFGENSGVYYSETVGMVMWGQDESGEESYWQNIATLSGHRTARDPYHYIDGGERPGGVYQFCCTSMLWKAHYGVTYGPDGGGGCIEDLDPGDGIGRFPLLHGSAADDGYYGSQFADAMWEAYVAGS